MAQVVLTAYEVALEKHFGEMKAGLKLVEWLFRSR
jgi:hypothetical protein